MLAFAVVPESPLFLRDPDFGTYRRASHFCLSRGININDEQTRVYESSKSSKDNVSVVRSKMFYLFPRLPY